MKVLVDCRTVRPGMSGVGVCTEGFVMSAIQCAPTSQFGVLTDAPDALSHFPANVARVSTSISHQSHPAAEWHLNTVIPGLLRREKYDVYWGAAFLVPWVTTGAVKAVTIHDVTVFDLPRCYPRKFALYLRTAITLSVRSADLIHAISEATRDAIVRRFPEAATRTIVAHPGVPEAISAADKHCPLPVGVKPPFVLAVGHGTPRKNIAPLADLFASGLLGADTGHSLVVVGDSPPLPEHPRVVPLPLLPPSELAPLYAAADLFVMPSLSEGFGLPMLEAMSFGCPVAASNRGSLPEVGGDAVVYFDPEDAGDMSRVIGRVLASPAERSSLALRARARAPDFDWGRSAQLIVDAMDRLVRCKEQQ